MSKIQGVIGGRYTVLEKLGAGGMSVVWLARDSRLERLQAIKEVKHDATDDIHRVDVDLMRKEAYIMKDLDHPNIVHVNDIIDEDGALYVVMDYVPGKDLLKIMQENRKAQGITHYAFPQDDVIEWGIQLCDAMGYLHSQKPPIIYRDMKPGNVMLQDDGSVKIIDFGIAREFKENQGLDTRPLGTRGYASPEAVEKVSQTDARSDIYSLGVTLFHLVTGHSPMEYVTQPNLPPIRQVNPALSPALEQSIIRTTQWDPNLRQQTMNELRYELENPVMPEDYVRMRNIMSRFKGLIIAGVIFVVLGIGSLITSRVLFNQSYQGFIDAAEQAVENDEWEEAENQYTAAIELNPSNIEPYSALLNEVYKSDEEFTTKEASRWSKLFEKHRSSIESQDGYAKVCYDAGIDTYVYYTYYGKDDEEALKDEELQASEAAKWFERAYKAYDDDTAKAQAGGMTTRMRDAAEAYKTIGEFSEILGPATQEGVEEQVYRDYWDALDAAVSMTSGNETIVQLRVNKTVFAAIVSPVYLQKFSNYDVTKEQVNDLYEKVITQTRKTKESALASDKAKELYDSIINNAAEAEANITSVYGGVATRLTKGDSSTTDAEVDE